MIKERISVVKLLMTGIAMLMLGSSLLLGQINVQLPTLIGQSGTEVTAPIIVGDLTGQNVTAFQFTLDYDDSNIIEITEATLGNVSGLAGGFLNFNADIANHRIVVAYANTTPLSGSGTLVNLKVRYKNTGTVALDFGTPSTFVFNAGTPTANVIVGSAQVPAIAIDVDDVSGHVGDTLLIPITTTNLSDADNVVTYNFTASYDETVIHIIGGETSGTLSANGMLSVNPNNTTGNVNVAWARATEITGNGVLLYLRAVVVGKGTADVTLNTWQFNTGNPGAVLFPGTVTITNRAPVWNTIPTPVNGTEQVALTIDAASYASDPDSDPVAITISATTLPAGYTFNAGVLSWTPGYMHAGTYTVTFNASDGTETVASNEVTIEIADANRAPSLVLNPAGPYTYLEGDNITINLVGTDEDVPYGDVLTYSYTNGLTGASLDPNTGIFTWTPGYDQEGTYAVTFTVTDHSGLTASVPAMFTIQNKNGAPSFIVPGAHQLASGTVREGQTFSFQYVAIDPENDAVTYYLVAPSPSTANIVPTGTNAGLFTWTPALGTAGTYQIAVLASDGVNTTAAGLATLVVTPNAAPIIAVNPPQTTFNVGELGSIAFSVTATDPDAGDVVTLTNTDLPAGATFTGGIFAWTPPTGAQGTYQITFTAKDQSNASDVETITINVSKTNLSPAFDLPVMADHQVNVGETVTFDYNATDPNGDALTFSLVSAPAGAAIDPVTGVLTWVTSPATILTTTAYTITVQVTDGSLTSQTTAVVTVFVPTYGISGKLVYDNVAATPVNGVTVTLTPAGGVAQTVVTDVNGDYSFTGLIAGTYNVTAAKTTPWGGVNSADALIASRYFNGLTTLDPVQVLAADVNNSGAVNNGDALLIVQRYVGIIDAFAKPDWVFYPATTDVVITNASAVVDMTGLVTGDVNKSFSYTSLAKNSSVNLVAENKLNVKPGEEFEVPVSVAEAMTAGAISLKLQYPADVVKYVGTTTSDSRILVKEDNGTISFAWADLTGGKNPIIAKANSVLATVKFSFIDKDSKENKFRFEVLDESEFVDAEGNTVQMKLSSPEVSVAVPTEFTIKQNFPNPFNPSTTISYDLPLNGHVSVVIYNITGQEIEKLFDGVQEAGSYQVIWNASDLASGIYFYRINFESAGQKITDTKSMILMK